MESRATTARKLNEMQFNRALQQKNVFETIDDVTPIAQEFKEIIQRTSADISETEATYEDHLCTMQSYQHAIFLLAHQLHCNILGSQASDAKQRLDELHALSKSVLTCYQNQSDRLKCDLNYCLAAQSALLNYHSIRAEHEVRKIANALADAQSFVQVTAPTLFDIILKNSKLESMTQTQLRLLAACYQNAAKIYNATDKPQLCLKFTTQTIDTLLHIPREDLSKTDIETMFYSYNNLSWAEHLTEYTRLNALNMEITTLISAVFMGTANATLKRFYEIYDKIANLDPAVNDQPLRYLRHAMRMLTVMHQHTLMHPTNLIVSLRNTADNNLFQSKLKLIETKLADEAKLTGTHLPPLAANLFSRDLPPNTQSRTSAALGDFQPSSPVNK